MAPSDAARAAFLKLNMKGAPADVRRRHGDSPKENKSEVIPKKTIMPAAVENPAHFVSTVHRP
jgi:hypothetical protein